MIMSEEIRNEYRWLISEGKQLKALEMISRFRMKHYNDLELIADKNFIDYSLARLNHFLGDKEMANKYLKQLEKTYSKKINISIDEETYYKTIWLDVNINKNIMSKEEIINKMSKVHRYYTEIGDITVSLCARETLAFLLNDKQMILQCLKEILKLDNDVIRVPLESILRDCDELNHNLYIEAIDIIEDYNNRLKSN